MNSVGKIRLTGNPSSPNQEVYNKEFIDGIIANILDRLDKHDQELAKCVRGNVFCSRWWKNRPTTKLERRFASVGLKFEPWFGDYPLDHPENVWAHRFSDFDNKPIFKDIKLCNIKQTPNPWNSNEITTTIIYQNDPSFRRDGSNGNVMVEIPKFYYNVVDTPEYRDFMITDDLSNVTDITTDSNLQLENWSISPRHAPTASNPNGWDKIYVSAYALTGNDYKSRSGAAPFPSSSANQKKGYSKCGNYCEQSWFHDV